MPLIQLDTSCDLQDQSKKDSLARTLSRLVAKGIGKPEHYVMVAIHDNVTMCMSGEAEPTALLTVKSIGGLTPSVNQTLTAKISRALQEELAIPPDRVYLTFEELPATHWGWNDSTFA